MSYDEEPRHGPPDPRSQAERERDWWKGQINVMRREVRDARVAASRQAWDAARLRKAARALIAAVATYYVTGCSARGCGALSTVALTVDGEGADLCDAHADALAASGVPVTARHELAWARVARELAAALGDGTTAAREACGEDGEG